MAAALGVVCLSPGIVYAECAADIIGKWQQTHVEFAGNKINDNTQSWEFMDDGSVRFVKTRPAIDVSGEYSCDGEVIFMKGRIPGRLKIVDYNGNDMAWESPDSEGVITHIVRVQQ